MEFILEDDFLAVVAKDKYDDMKAKAKANDEHTTSTAEVVMSVVCSAVVVGAIGYMGYQAVSSIKESERRLDLNRKRSDFRREMDELKARVEKMK